MRAVEQPAAIVALLVLLAVQSTPAQPQFRAGTELVVVDVVATRLDGNVARTLTAADFEIFEDGTRQEIRTFEFVDLEANTNPADPTGVFSNQVEAGGIFAIVVDELSVEARHTPALRRWAQRFVQEQVRADDYLGVMNTGVDFALTLTRDHDLVEAKLAQVSGRGVALTTTTPTGRVQTSTTPDQPILPDFSGVDQVDTSAELRATTERTIRTLHQVVEYLTAIPARRKSVLFFSQGIGLDLESLADKGLSRGFEPMGQLLDAARAGNVAIYGIDPRGLAGDDNAITAEAPQPVTADAGIDGLRDLARATGGRAVVNSNDLRGALARIANENRAYFLIGYEPTNNTRSRNRLRRIEVRTRAPGVTLLHRAARMAMEDSRTPTRGPAVAPLPGGNLFVALAPALFPDPKKGVSLAVPFEVGTAVADGTALTYSLIAIDARGRQAAGTTGKIAAAGGRGTGLARLHLPPGRYQVRLSAQVENSDQQGLAIADVHVAAAAASSPLCGGFLIVQKDGASLRPSVMRRLRAGDALMVAAVVSSREAIPATFEALAQSGGAVLSLTMRNPVALRNGMWRYELTLPPPLPSGAIDLLLLDGDVPIPGCRTELWIE
jgi:VWFA-related protein